MSQKKFGVAADPVIVNDEKVLLVRRNGEPFDGKWEFPGGFMEDGETIEETCVREAKEETGLDVEPLEILGVYTDPKRDPRGQTVGVAFVCWPKTTEVKLNDEASEYRWVRLDEIDGYEMAFDHAKIIGDLGKWMKTKGTYWSTKRT